jgi:hypothetical protein
MERRPGPGELTRAFESQALGERDEATQGRELDAQIDRLGTQAAVDLALEIDEIAEWDLEPCDTTGVLVDLRRARGDAPTRMPQRREAIEILIHERVEEIEDDPANHRS